MNEPSQNTVASGTATARGATCPAQSSWDVSFHVAQANFSGFFGYCIWGIWLSLETSLTSPSPHNSWGQCIHFQPPAFPKSPMLSSSLPQAMEGDMLLMHKVNGSNRIGYNCIACRASGHATFPNCCEKAVHPQHLSGFYTDQFV